MLCLTRLTAITWISLQVLWGFGWALTRISSESDIRVCRCSHGTKRHWTLHGDVCYLLPLFVVRVGRCQIILFVLCCRFTKFLLQNDHLCLYSLDLWGACSLMNLSVNKLLVNDVNKPIELSVHCLLMHRLLIIAWTCLFIFGPNLKRPCKSKPCCCHWSFTYENTIL